MENQGSSLAGSPRPNNWLLFSRRNVYSQDGEDGIIAKVLEMLPPGDHWCVEFGAWDGKHLSNVFRLIAEDGWSGVLIEASQQKFHELLRTCQSYENVICENKMVHFEGEDRLDNILAKTPIPVNFDLLSIDIDGNDYHVWNSLDRYAPKIVVVEFNPTIPHGIQFIQPRKIELTQGASLLSLYDLGKKKGYELIAATRFNAVFVQRAYFDIFQIKDNAPEAIHQDKSLQTQIFQLYDGSLVTTGCNKLLWHEVDITQKNLQLLPVFLRTYPGNYNLLQKIMLRLLKALGKFS